MALEPTDRTWGCQRCGHAFELHQRTLRDACRAYHCHCRGWLPIREEDWRRSRE